MTSLVQVTVENQASYLKRILEIETLSFSTAWSLNGFLRELENPISQLWALTCESVLLGYICFRTVQEEAEILDLAVHPNYRGQGHGAFLLAHMINQNRFKGISTIWLEVRVSGSTARRLYEKFGFVENGRRTDYYTDPREDAIVMSLALTRMPDNRFPKSAP